MSDKQTNTSLIPTSTDKKSTNTSLIPTSTDKKLNNISRQLVKILRHQIVDFGLNADSNGFVNINEIFTNPKIHIDKINIQQLQHIVDTNEKKRLELEHRHSGYWIRAVQGHSESVGAILNEETAFEEITKPYPEIYHGTESKYVDSIMKSGLNKMSRKHIHLVAEYESDKQISGYKSRSNAVVVIDMPKCISDGMKFYKSSNNVILTSGFDGIINAKYIKEIKYLN